MTRPIEEITIESRGWGRGPRGGLVGVSFSPKDCSTYNATPLITWVLYGHFKRAAARVDRSCIRLQLQEVLSSFSRSFYDGSVFRREHHLSDLFAATTTKSAASSSADVTSANSSLQSLFSAAFYSALQIIVVSA